MKRIVKKTSILMILMFILALTTPVASVTFANECLTGDGCPSDGDGAQQGGPKSPPPKDTSILCQWLGICKAS